MTIDRLHPYQPFDPSLIDSFLRGRQLVSVDLLPLGKCNSNYKLVLADGGTYIVRLRSRGDAGREAYVMDLVRDLVPVPQEIERGEGWSVYTCLPGAVLADVLEDCGKAAEALARFASVRFPSSGWINADGSVSPFVFGKKSDGSDEDDFMAAMLKQPDVLAWIGQEAADAVAAIMQREAGRMAVFNETPSLVHGDYNLTNILVHNGEVSGVLDWEFAHAGTPYMDIGNLIRCLDPKYYDRIRAGLAAGGMQVPDDWLELALLIDVSSQVEFLTKSCADAIKQACVEQISRFIRQFRD